MSCGAAVEAGSRCPACGYDGRAPRDWPLRSSALTGEWLEKSAARSPASGGDMVAAFRRTRWIWAASILVVVLLALAFNAGHAVVGLTFAGLACAALAVEVVLVRCGTWIVVAAQLMSALDGGLEMLAALPAVKRLHAAILTQRVCFVAPFAILVLAVLRPHPEPAPPVWWALWVAGAASSLAVRIGVETRAFHEVGRPGQ